MLDTKKLRNKIRNQINEAMMNVRSEYCGLAYNDLETALRTLDELDEVLKNAE